MREEPSALPCKEAPARPPFPRSLSRPLDLRLVWVRRPPTGRPPWSLSTDREWSGSKCSSPGKSLEFPPLAQKMLRAVVARHGGSGHEERMLRCALETPLLRVEASHELDRHDYEAAPKLGPRVIVVAAFLRHHVRRKVAYEGATLSPCGIVEAALEEALAPGGVLETTFGVDDATGYLAAYQLCLRIVRALGGEGSAPPGVVKWLHFTKAACHGDFFRDETPTLDPLVITIVDSRGSLMADDTSLVV